MKCKSCKADVEVSQIKSNDGKCPFCKQPAGKKYRYPARPIQKGKSKRTQQERSQVMTCDFTSGKFNSNGSCTKLHFNHGNKTCAVCLKLTKKQKRKTNKAHRS